MYDKNKTKLYNKEVYIRVGKKDSAYVVAAQDLEEPSFDSYSYQMNVLDDELIEHTFKNDIERRFHYLKRDLDSDRNLHSINGKIKESENIKIGFLNEINTFKKLNDSTNNKIDIYINELLDDEINISNEEEMELFLEKIKKEVKKELDENKIVRIINN